MNRSRSEPTGAFVPGDPTPELPGGIVGLIEPHALLALHWENGLPEGDSELSAQLSSEEISTIDLIDDESSGAHELTFSPPPTPPTAPLSAPPSGPHEALRPQPPPPPPPSSYVRITSGRKKPVENKEGIDAMMSEIVATEEVSTGRKRGGHWWAEIFDDTWLRMLPPSIGERSLREVRFLEQQASLRPGARVLDVGCGYGRHLVPLALKGYELVGVDLSQDYLEIAWDEAHARGIHLELFQGDMRDLPCENEFDAAFCWQTTFGYFGDDANRKLFQRMARALKPGGYLFIEQVSRDYVVQHCPRRLWWEVDDMVIMEDITFDHTRSRLVVERQIADGPKEPWEQKLAIRLYAPNELIQLARETGLEPVALTGDIAHPARYIGNENRSVILTARKPLQ